MRPVRKLSRRSFLVRVGGGLALGGALSGCVGFSDSDPYDPIGGGGGGGGDRGGWGRGRGRGRGGGCTDADTGRRADPAGRGRC